MSGNRCCVSGGCEGRALLSTPLTLQRADNDMVALSYSDATEHSHSSPKLVTKLEVLKEILLLK